MPKVKEGFKGERLVSLPQSLLDKYGKDPLVKNLYLRKIGFFPHVKYHYVQKDRGCDYAMLIYCTDGEGWYRIHGARYALRKDECVILPAGTPYAFGADNDNPWTIYWLHFQGADSPLYRFGDDRPRSIAPGDRSRLQERLQLFEELFHCFALAYTCEYMRYSSACLHLFLASFLYIEPYRSIRTFVDRKSSFAGKVIRYMQENLHHPLTLEQLAAYFNYSPSHFSMLFQRETGIPPISYLARLKIQKACQYIELSDLKLQDISLALGFEDPAYFSRSFTRIMGMSPSEYRKREKAYASS